MFFFLRKEQNSAEARNYVRSYIFLLFLQLRLGEIASAQTYVKMYLPKNKNTKATNRVRKYSRQGHYLLGNGGQLLLANAHDKVSAMIPPFNSLVFAQ